MDFQPVSHLSIASTDGRKYKKKGLLYIHEGVWPFNIYARKGKKEVSKSSRKKGMVLFMASPVTMRWVVLYVLLATFPDQALSF